MKALLGVTLLVLTNVAQAASEAECLALNIYHEARSESIDGQVGVAVVTLNRVASSQYPNTVCEVVKEYRQFSWYWDGKPDTPFEKAEWYMAQKLAEYMLKHPDISQFDFTDGALWYYNPSIVGRPYWHDETKVITRIIGRHVFLRSLRM